MSQSPPSSDQATHVLETILKAMLVVILLAFVAGVSLVLLIPAIQHAREDARREQLRENLKQVGLALQSYSAGTTAGPTGPSDPRSVLSRPEAASGRPDRRAFETSE